MPGDGLPSTDVAMGLGTEDGDPAKYAPERLFEGIAVLTAEPLFAGMLARAGSPRFRHAVAHHPRAAGVDRRSRGDAQEACRALQPLEAGNLSRTRRRDASQ